MIARRFVRALGLGASLAVLAVSAVYADNFQVNDISATTVTTGNTATADYRIVATGGGGSEPAGCNVDSSNSASVTFSITGGPSGGVTYSPAAGLTFTECQAGGDANEQTVTFTGVSAGTYTITPVITGGRSGSTWGLGGGTFTLTVNTPPPSDTTAPVITPNVAGTPGANGWYTSDVSVSWTVVDAESSVTSTSGCDTTSLTSETTGVTLTCTATSAGGTDSESITIKIDKTGPSAALTPTGTSGDNGWYTSNVDVAASGSDAISGPVTCTVDDGATPKTFSAETSGTTVNGECTNDAGLSTAASAITIKIDKTAPTSLAFVGGGPTDGASYVFGSVPAGPTGCTADGAISGLASCNVSGYGTSVGMHTLTATATDNAGNVATKELSYTVLAWTLNGFYQPVDIGITNSVKGGSTVPLKFEIFAGSNELTSTSDIKSFTVTKTGCAAGAPTDDIEVYSTGGTILRYDSTGGQFIQNWQTPKGAGICYRVVMTTQDLSTLVATFMTK